MILTDTDILARIASNQLLSNHVPANVTNCGYILRAGRVFEPHTGHEQLLGGTSGSVPTVWELGPSEVLVVMTRESVKMPKELCASYTPLYRLAGQGVMLLNASIVEPGYEGPLSCFLLNFSSEHVSFAPDASIAKIVFHEMKSAPGHLQPATLQSQEYGELLAASAMKFTKSFMDVAEVEKRAVEKATSTAKRLLLLGGVMVAVLLAWSTLEPVVSKWVWEKTAVISDARRASDEKLLLQLEHAESTRELKARIEELSAEIKDLRQQIDKQAVKPK